MRRGAACLLGFGLGGLADLVGNLGAELLVEEVLEGEPGAAEIEQDLVESALLIGLSTGSVGPGGIAAESVRERRADQSSCRDASLPSDLLDAFQQLRGQPHRVWNLRH